jgi:hypothetical protein
MIRPAVVAHADWSADPRRRRATVARDEGGGWSVSAPEPAGDPATLAERLSARAARPGPLLIGVDFPIGVPVAWGGATGAASFPALLPALGEGRWARFFEPAAAPDAIARERPFYPARPGGARRAHLETALGLPFARLLRRCDRATCARPAACALFWTLGGQQVGKAAIAGWRDLVRPALAAGAGLWPFDGPLGALLATRAVVIAETYPAEALRQAGVAPGRGWSKRRAADRAAVAPALHAFSGLAGARLAPEAARALDEGCARHGGDDGFDSLVGCLAMLGLLARDDDGAPRDDPDVLRWEGWILGQRAA